MDKLLKGKFRKLNDNIFLLKYENDYALDALLEKGVRNVGELASFMQKHFKARKNEIKMSGGDFACTTFNAYTESGDHIMARNFDFKEAPVIVVWTNPEKGYKSIGVTETDVLLVGKKLAEKENKNHLLLAPYACMDGMNEKGLAIAVVEIKTKATKQETGKKPIITTVAIRAALDKCATVDEAVELFKQYDMHDSLFACYHYQVTDASGKSAIIEYIDNKMTVLYPDDKYQYLVNKYATPGVPCEKGFGYTREKWLAEEFAETNHIMDEKRAMKILERVKLFYKHKRGYMITSLWSVIYNLEKKSCLFCANMEYDKQFTFTLDYPEK